MTQYYSDDKMFRTERDAIVLDVIRNYHVNEWARITHNRSINERPKRLQQLHYDFARRHNACPQTPEERKAVLCQLRRIRNALRIEYMKLRIRRNLYGWYTNKRS